jgi:hypothetical protein
LKLNDHSIKFNHKSRNFVDKLFSILCFVPKSSTHKTYFIAAHLFECHEKERSKVIMKWHIGMSNTIARYYSIFHFVLYFLYFFTYFNSNVRIQIFKIIGLILQKVGRWCFQSKEDQPIYIKNATNYIIIMIFWKLT